MQKTSLELIRTVLESAGYEVVGAILALTASAMHGDRERALSAGFSAYITKPVDIQFLRSEVDCLTAV